MKEKSPAGQPGAVRRDFFVLSELYFQNFILVAMGGCPQTCMNKLRVAPRHGRSRIAPTIRNPFVLHEKRAQNGSLPRVWTPAYSAPSCLRTTETVFNRIWKSSSGLQFWIYSRSSLTTSSKSVISLRPLICHRPVIPGLMLIRTRWCRSYFSHSSKVGGLVPTRLISPFRTFKNWVNSSRDVRRIKLPIPAGRPFLFN